MIVVSDTTPLRYLIELDLAFILESLFERVIVPQAVLNDLQQAKTPAAVKKWIANRPAWLELQQADATIYTPRKRIGDGEREAFALAIQLQADAVLLDDQGAMVEAKRIGLRIIRTFDILESAAEDDLIDLHDAVERMRGTTFRMPPAETIDAMLERDRQRKQLEP